MGLLDELLRHALPQTAGARGADSDARIETSDADVLSGVLKEIFADKSGTTQKPSAGHAADVGGLTAIIEKLEKGGLAEIVRSWIGTGENLPITPTQLRMILSNREVQAIARSFGLPVDEILVILAKVLPEAVDSASPQGQLPYTK